MEDNEFGEKVNVVLDNTASISQPDHRFRHSKIVDLTAIDLDLPPPAFNPN